MGECISKQDNPLLTETYWEKKYDYRNYICFEQFLNDLRDEDIFQDKNFICKLCDRNWMKMYTKDLQREHLRCNECIKIYDLIQNFSMFQQYETQVLKGKKLTKFSLDWKDVILGLNIKRLNPSITDINKHSKELRDVIEEYLPRDITNIILSMTPTEEVKLFILSKHDYNNIKVLKDFSVRDESYVPFKFVYGKPYLSLSLYLYSEEPLEITFKGFALDLKTRRWLLCVYPIMFEELNIYMEDCYTTSLINGKSLIPLRPWDGSLYGYKPYTNRESSDTT